MHTPQCEFSKNKDIQVQLSKLEYLTVYNAGDQPRLIQGIRRRDGVGEDQETTA